MAHLNPKIVGPGYWSIIHITAIRATTNKKLKEFKQFMDHVSIVFPCSECKTHMLEYMNKNPITEDAFKWSWKFHNTINKKLGKKTITLQKAYEMYTPTEDDEVCSEECEVSL